MIAKKRVVIATLHEVVGEALAAAFEARAGFATVVVPLSADRDIPEELLTELPGADVVVMELGPNRLAQEVAAMASLKSNPDVHLVTVLTDSGKAWLFNPGGQPLEILDNPSIEALVERVTKPSGKPKALGRGQLVRH